MLHKHVNFSPRRSRQELTARAEALQGIFTHRSGHQSGPDWKISSRSERKGLAENVLGPRQTTLQLSAMSFARGGKDGFHSDSFLFCDLVRQSTREPYDSSFGCGVVKELTSISLMLLPGFCNEQKGLWHRPTFGWPTNEFYRGRRRSSPSSPSNGELGTND